MVLLRHPLLLTVIGTTARLMATSPAQPSALGPFLNSTSRQKPQMLWSEVDGGANSGRRVYT